MSIGVKALHRCENWRFTGVKIAVKRFTGVRKAVKIAVKTPVKMDTGCTVGVNIGVETCEKGPGVNIDVRYNSHCTLVWTLACTLV